MSQVCVKKYYWECETCHSRFFSEPTTLGIRNGQLVKFHPICTRCFEKCPSGHPFGYGETCNICSQPRRRFNLIRHELDPDDPTFGLTATGSTSYPTTADTIGSTANNATTSGFITGSAIVATASGTLTSIGINIQTAAGNIRVALYSTYSASKFSGLLGQSADTVAVGGWNDLSIGAVAIVSGMTYYIGLQASSGTLKMYYAASGTQYYVTAAYAAFADPTATLSSQSGYCDNMRITYAKIAGYAKATKATLPYDGDITSLTFYTHASGNARLAIYNDSSGPNTKLWESGSVACSAASWNSPNISDGTPTTLSLVAGTYWLGWQWDSVNAGPSYTAGSAGGGNYIAQAYGAFPTTWTGGTSTAEKWSEYATYTAIPPPPPGPFPTLPPIMNIQNADSRVLIEHDVPGRNVAYRSARKTNGRTVTVTCELRPTSIGDALLQIETWRRFSDGLVRSVTFNETTMYAMLGDVEYVLEVGLWPSRIPLMLTFLECEAPT
jgi:hypothetical protein